MGNKVLYFDNAATTAIDEETISNITNTLRGLNLNPSSPYAIDEKALLEDSRAIIAATINCKPEEIYFTSGATESNNWAIKGFCARKGYGVADIYTTDIEHPSVYETCKYLNDTVKASTYYIPLDEDGKVVIDELEDLMVMCDGLSSQKLVTVMMANNEIGTIQPMKEICEVAHRFGAIVHTDATQAYMHLNIDVQELGVDMMTVSGHKFGCPKGVGFLYVREGVEIDNLMQGGHQEENHRPGTENLAYISAMACRAFNLSSTIADREAYVRHLRARLYIELVTKFISLPCSVILNGPAYLKCLPGLLSITIPGVDAQELIALLAAKNIYVSSGSACSSGENTPSRVLTVIGISEEDAKSTIRITLDETNTWDDCLILIDELYNAVVSIRKFL